MCCNITHICELSTRVCASTGKSLVKVASSYVGKGISLFQETCLRALSICLHTFFQFSTARDVHSRDVSFQSMQPLNRKRSLSPLCGKVGAKCLMLGLMLRFV